MAEKREDRGVDSEAKLDDANPTSLHSERENGMRQRSWQVPGTRHQATWFCAQTHYGQDKLAIHDLTHPDSARKQYWEAFCPEVYERRTSTDRGGRERTRRVLVPMFPGYIFVRFDMRADPWKRIIQAKGVARILGSTPERPTPLPADLIIAVAQNAADLNAEFQALAEALHPKGAALRVTKGPWAGFEGVCLWHKNDRVRLMMSIFGRDSEVEMAATDVEAPTGEAKPQWQRRR